jgi:hypothetical protein
MPAKKTKSRSPRPQDNSEAGEMKPEKKFPIRSEGFGCPEVPDNCRRRAKLQHQVLQSEFSQIFTDEGIVPTLSTRFPYALSTELSDQIRGTPSSELSLPTAP